MVVMVVTMGMGMGVTAMAVGHGIPLHAGDLVHPAVGNQDLHLKIRIKEALQAVGRHKAVGDLAGGTLVVVVDDRPAGAMGNGQPSALFQQTRQGLDEPLGIGEMGEGIVHHHLVKFSVEHRLLHIAAEDPDHITAFVFGRSDLRHFGGNVNTGDGSGAPFQIIREHNTGAAGNIQNILSGGDFRVVQDGVDNRIAFDQFRVPAGSAAVEKFCNVSLIQVVSSPFW